MTQYRVRITPLLMLLFWQMAVGCALASTPYDRIVGRNLFGIKPAVPAPPTDSIKIPIIELQGIHVILEKKQVLFKFANSSKFGYILAEGESQDGIKIVGIDVKGGIVKIINYGVPQTLDMVKNSAAFAGFSEVKVFGEIEIGWTVTIYLHAEGHQVCSRQDTNLGTPATIFSLWCFIGQQVIL